LKNKILEQFLVSGLTFKVAPDIRPQAVLKVDLRRCREISEG
jgi:hypothetical protein